MKKFVLKYKWRICYLLIFSIIVIYIAPRQSDYYLNEDIETFKDKYLVLILIGTWFTIAFLCFFFIHKNLKPFKRAVNILLYISLMLTIYIFIFQRLILAATLFWNRQFKRDSFTKTYTVSYLVGTEENKDNFVLYDISTREINIERKLKEKLYRPGLKENDTLTLKFDKGLFGIDFQSEPFVDKR